MITKKQAENHWAHHKYEIMAKGYQFYTTIRDRFREAGTEKEYLEILAEIDVLTNKPYTKKGFVTTAEHMWGYFKKEATASEKETFFMALQACSTLPDTFTKLEGAALDVIVALQQLERTYSRPYLAHSSLLQ
ncbi:hypothetical protein A374_18324 [Fictibacillus macauensis ZFHKF-1]|uniref:DUF1722 domain-containing protein n=1 Tax=Fictibacillus macauensis ZFHKF-1 TaxID=1196324 RepID=I8IWE9_9BACL|nr:DUF1722 domain-containing protein [Fictibacillus macauensis]EIT83811.1 hypothetical protein A374_18324 [Fictibacillus macauensis ZFHKF-1]